MGAGTAELVAEAARAEAGEADGTVLVDDGETVLCKNFDNTPNTPERLLPVGASFPLVEEGDFCTWCGAHFDAPVGVCRDRGFAQSEAWVDCFEARRR